MLPKNIYEHPKFYELKMMVRGERINRSFAFSSKRDKDKALKEAIAFKEATLKSFEKYDAPIHRNPSKVRFKEIVDLYKREKIAYEKSKSKTENLLKLAGERFPQLMDKRLSDLTVSDFEQVREWLVKNGYSEATANHYLTQFSGVFNYARKIGFDIPNLTEGLQFELDNEQQEVLSRDELKEIVNELQNERTKLAIQFLFFTACRRSEVVNMKFEDIDFKKKILRLNKTKNGKSHDVILNNTCIKILEKMKKMDGDKGYVFKSYDSGRNEPVNIDCWTRAWRRAVKRLYERTGNEKWLRKRLHTLRHSRITEYAAQVTNTIVLRDITGHKDLRSLARYSHTTDETKRSHLGELAEE